MFSSAYCSSMAKNPFVFDVGRLERSGSDTTSGFNVRKECSSLDSLTWLFFVRVKFDASLC